MRCCRPSIDATRTLRVRVELPNRDGRLRPGQSAQVTLSGASKGEALVVPTEAVIRTGKRAAGHAGRAGQFPAGGGHIWVRRWATAR